MVYCLVRDQPDIVLSFLLPLTKSKFCVGEKYSPTPRFESHVKLWVPSVPHYQNHDCYHHTITLSSGIKWKPHPLGAPIQSRLLSLPYRGEGRTGRSTSHYLETHT